MLIVNCIEKRTGTYRCIHRESGQEITVEETTSYDELSDEFGKPGERFERLKSIETEAGLPCVAMEFDGQNLKVVGCITVDGTLPLEVIEYTPR